MINKANLLIVLALSLLIYTPLTPARDYVIYSIMQDFPMGSPSEVLKKNFYINMGKMQGIKNGALLDVQRSISVLDPYQNKKRFEHNVKIGTLKVIHTESETAIAEINEFSLAKAGPLLDVNSFMIGDKVSINLK